MSTTAWIVVLLVGWVALSVPLALTFAGLVARADRAVRAERQRRDAELAAGYGENRDGHHT